VVVDEQAVKPVRDGTKRLNESHGILFPIADPGPVKMMPPRKSQGRADDSNLGEIDSPEFKAMLNRPAFPWMKQRDIDSPEYRNFVKRGRAQQYETVRTIADPLEQAGVDAYHAAVEARHLGLPFDAQIIALHTSAEWRDESFRAAYYENQRKR